MKRIFVHDTETSCISVWAKVDQNFVYSQIIHDLKTIDLTRIKPLLFHYYFYVIRKGARIPCTNETTGRF